MSVLCSLGRTLVALGTSTKPVSPVQSTRATLNTEQCPWWSSCAILSPSPPSPVSVVSSFTGHCQQGRSIVFYFCQILANCWNTMFQLCLIMFCAIIIQPRYKLRRWPLHYVRVCASVQTGLRHRKLSSPLWLQCGRTPCHTLRHWDPQSIGPATGPARLTSLSPLSAQQNTQHYLSINIIFILLYLYFI